MAKRQIDDKLIDDPWMITLKTDEKLLYIYLFLSPNQEITGIYKYSLEMLSLRTSIPIERVKIILEKFKKDGKAFYEENYIIIPEYCKNISYNLPDIKKYVLKQLEELPPSIIKNHPELISKLQELASTKTNQRLTSTTDQSLTSMTDQYNRPANTDQPLTSHTAPTERSISTSISNSISKSIHPSTCTEKTSTNRYGLRQLGNFVQLPDGKVVRREEMNKLKRMDGMDGSEKIPSQDGMDGMKKTNEKKGKNPEKEKGWRPNAGYYAEGIWLTDEEFNKLRTEFGDDIALNSPEITSSWAKEKGIEIIDTYKMCKKIAKKMLEEQNGKNC
jgi:hypothetical protein